jgi:hypothetical protein
MNNALHNHNCPALMSDGRVATDYRPSCVVETLINTQNDLTNSHQTRAFLQENAVKFMAMNQSYFQNQFQCPSGGNFYHIDPNENDKYWVQYKTALAKKSLI